MNALDDLSGVEGLIYKSQVVLGGQSHANIDGLGSGEIRRQSGDDVVFVLNVKSLANQQTSVNDSALSETDQLLQIKVRSVLEYHFVA